MLRSLQELLLQDEAKIKDLEEEIDQLERDNAEFQLRHKM